MSVYEYLGMDYFIFLYAGDSLGGVEWDERSFIEVANSDKKKEVALLAFELAHIMSKYE